jgi:phosphoribosylformimino-5-aminoimidazole carboxamide ribotide isomerase
MIRIIPAIDIIEGKCVRLSQGDFNKKKVYNNNPVEVAKQFQDSGIKRLHLVDLDGARTGAVKNWEVLDAIASQTTLQIDFGGGIASTENVITALDSGATYISVGSIAVKNKLLFSDWLLQFGPGKFLLGADVRDEKIVVTGWKDTTAINVFGFVSHYVSCGVNSIFCTDVSKDGMMKGPSIDLYKKLLQQNKNMNLIASGGVSSLTDIDELDQTGCYGVIIGKAIYEGTITLKELQQYAN